MLHYLLTNVQQEIDQGHADEAIQEFTIIGREDLEMEFLLLAADGRRMTLGQAKVVVRLLSACGYERGEREEMWGNVFEGGRKLGEVALASRREGVES